MLPCTHNQSIHFTKAICAALLSLLAMLAPQARAQTGACCVGTGCTLRTLAACDGVLGGLARPWHELLRQSVLTHRHVLHRNHLLDHQRRELLWHVPRRHILRSESVQRLVLREWQLLH